MGCCDLPASTGVGGTGYRVLQPALDGRGRGQCCGPHLPRKAWAGAAAVCCSTAAAAAGPLSPSLALTDVGYFESESLCFMGYFEAEYLCFLACSRSNCCSFIDSECAATRQQLGSDP